MNQLKPPAANMAKEKKEKGARWSVRKRREPGSQFYSCLLRKKKYSGINPTNKEKDLSNGNVKALMEEIKDS